MKTKITTLLMISAFLVSFASFADETPNAPKSSPPGWYLGPPIETPRHTLNSIEGRIAMFMVDLFYTDSRNIHPLLSAKSFRPAEPVKD